MAKKTSFEKLYENIHEEASAGVWSKGVALARDGLVFLDKKSTAEILLRIRIANNAVSPKVTLWPNDEDWHCDCLEKKNICMHITAAVVALKNKQTKESAAEESTSPSLFYRFTEKNGYLCFERGIREGKKEIKIHNSLVSYMGGIQSGRIKATPPTVTKEDYAIDHILGSQFQNPLDRYTLTKLLSALKNIPITFNGEAIQISALTVSPQAKISEEKHGFRLSFTEDASVTKLFKNGVALSGNQLKAIRDPLLSPKEKEFFRYIPEEEIHRFVAEIMPTLSAKMNIVVDTKRLPSISKARPEILLHMQAESKDRLSVYPMLVYGTPPVAELRNNILVPISSKEVPERDIEEERNLARRLHHELQLQVGKQTVFEKESAIHFISKTRSWNSSGNGYEKFSVAGELEVKTNLTEDTFDLSFTLTGRRAPQGISIDPSTILKAWRENKSYIQLDNGSWAALPMNWLAKYGDRIESMLSFKTNQPKLPKYLIPDLVEFCEENKQDFPEKLKQLKLSLQTLEEIPDAKIPKDLRADLRSYQRVGVNWLQFLRNQSMGAMLADDMGLGKTLQTITCLEGKCLVLCPTSVLASWAEQIREFRPALGFSIYHGSERKLDNNIILTSYGILRMDQELILQTEWDMIILDEAQTIKNPDSQTARLVHKLQAKAKIALSGTPIENRLDDLWSQFHFLNPGLLGSREEFIESYETSPELVKRKIKPFILRRLKKDVAPELPPRTEVTLRCELSEDEKNLYRSILASSRKEVLEELQTGNVMAALEMLLRLRQTCCHPSLVPGSGFIKDNPSAKLNLLLQSLEDSIGNGHRALVFSQWTSLLDILQQHITAKGFSFSRLDGSTRNRSEVVSDFQKKDGPSLMLISLKAGGVGITLTAADHIFIMDPWWNPAIEDQAADRAHRIGQENPVLVHRLVAENTVEDRILLLQKKKQALAESLLGSAQSASAITKEDLLALLE